jgi:transposase-like protein
MALTDITNKTSERRSQRSDEDYGRIIGIFEAGQSQIDTSKEMGIPPQTVNKAIQRWQKFGTAIPKKNEQEGYPS